MWSMKVSQSPLNRHPGESRDPFNKRHASSADRVDRIYWAPAFAGVTVGLGVTGKADSVPSLNVSKKTKEEVP